MNGFCRGQSCTDAKKKNRNRKYRIIKELTLIQIEDKNHKGENTELIKDQIGQIKTVLPQLSVNKLGYSK